MIEHAIVVSCSVSVSIVGKPANEEVNVFSLMNVFLNVPLIEVLFQFF